MYSTYVHVYTLSLIQTHPERHASSASSCSSLCNPTECSLVVELCRVLEKSVPEKDIGVITPYKAQEKLIRRKLNRPNIEVGTVDGFQVLIACRH